jgi:hypothetical protein
MDSDGKSQDAWVHYYEPEPGSLNDIRDKYARGIHIKKSELVEALEAHRDYYIPSDIAPLICGYLRRDIKSPRGRHARQKHHVEYYVEAMETVYKQELERLRQLKKEHGTLRGRVPSQFENMAPNEVAAALVARECPQLNITGRRVQNLISANKKQR